MRREKLPLSRAAKLEGTNPKTVRRYASSAMKRKGVRGPFRVTASDRISRPVRFLTPQGSVWVTAKGSRDASNIAEHRNAVTKYRRTGDASVLARFRGKVLGTANGAFYPFVTDTDVLDELGRAGLPAPNEGLYRSIQGGTL
jgi:hypothetical protein